MDRIIAILTALLACIVLAGCVPGEGPPEKDEAAPPGTEASAKTPELPKAGYDPERDPDRDLAEAVSVAKSSGRRILLEVGGEWCVWCRILEKFLHDNPDVNDTLKSSFVFVKVNYSEENRNEEFLAEYPEVSGYPHIFVLDSDGTLLHSQNTAELEEGRSYGHEKMMAFLRKWAPPGKAD